MRRTAEEEEEGFGVYVLFCCLNAIELSWRHVYSLFLILYVGILLTWMAGHYRNMMPSAYP